MFYQAQLQPYALSGAGVVAGATTIILKSFQTIDGVNLTMADFGSTGYITLEPGNGTLEEQASFTGVTQNANGTATLTGIKSVLFLTPYTETTGLSKTHAGSTSVVVSNTAGFYTEFGVKENNETLTGYWQAPNPLATQGIATKNYVDTLVNGGTVTTDALIEVGVAGETVAAGDPVYLKAADGRWWKAIGTTAATVNTTQLGIAQGAGTAASNITGGVLRRGVDTHQSGGSAGALGYISDTSTIATTTGTVERVVGNFLTATTFDFDPAFYYTLSASQKGALAGSLGTPSGTNKYLTELNETTGGIDQSQATQNATVIFGEADSATEQNRIAQSFIPDKTKIRGVSLYKIADSGTFTGTVTVTLQADTVGSPSGVALATATLTNAQWLRIVAGEFNAIFSSEYTTLTLGSLYWIVLSTSTADNTNHPNVGSNSAGGYTDGSVKYNNTADGWVAIATIDLYFKTLEGNVSQIVVTETNGYVSPSLVPQLIGSRTTSVSIVDGNSSAETTLFGITIPGGLLGTKNIVRAHLYFSAVGIVSTATLVFRVKYGTTTISTFTIPTGSTMSLAGHMDIELLANVSASAQIGSGQIALTGNGREITTGTEVTISKIQGVGSGTATENSANTLDLTVTAQYDSNNASNDLTLLYGYAEVIRQP